MDWLIVLLIVIGVISRASKKKKQQAQKQFQQRQAGFDEAAELQQGGANRLAEVLRDVSKELEDELAPHRSSKPAKPAAQLPYTKEEWQKLFAAPKPQPKPVDKPKAAPAATPTEASATPTAAPIKALESKALERGVTGSIQLPLEAMEGEAPLEHAAHRQRVIADEERLHQEHAQLRELRSANLQKLRSAVVMSEVLGKPVSLRARGRR